MEIGRPLATVDRVAHPENADLSRSNGPKRKRDIDTIPPPNWDSFEIKSYLSRNLEMGINLDSSMPTLTTRERLYQCTFVQAQICEQPAM